VWLAGVLGRFPPFVTMASSAAGYELRLRVDAWAGVGAGVEVGAVGLGGVEGGKGGFDVAAGLV
jgi:hypothetical protein